jgi:alpha-aminoadipate/glutamate carrier protein LysW
MVNCPVCDAAIDVEEDELDEGEAVSCDECGATLNVVSTDPLELAPGVDDDEDEDEEDEDISFDEDDEDEDEEEDEDDEEEEWK